MTRTVAGDKGDERVTTGWQRDISGIGHDAAVPRYQRRCDIGIKFKGIGESRQGSCKKKGRHKSAHENSIRCYDVSVSCGGWGSTNTHFRRSPSADSWKKVLSLGK
jgi:hypothetical protein